MKKSIILSLGLSLILTSCTIDWKDENTEFKKKQECIKYKNWLQKDIDKRIKDYNYNEDWFKQTYTEKILEILYSKKYNTCYAITSNNTFWIKKEWRSNIVKIDLLSNQEEELLIKNEYYDFTIDTPDVLKIIKELKWE